jgi:hypothetical protein
LFCLFNSFFFFLFFSGFTNLQKVGLGLFFSMLGMAAAALVEKRRLSVFGAHRSTMTKSATLPISAFFLLPQFMIVGIGEAFIFSGELAFFTTNAPKGMKAISTGLCLTINSFGMFLSTTLIIVVRNVTGRKGGHDWLTPRINDGRLDNYYCLLALLNLIDLGLYILCAIRFKPTSSDNAPKMNGAVDTPPHEENE